METRIKPTVALRKLESKILMENSIKYLEDSDFKMSEIAYAIVGFFK